MCVATPALRLVEEPGCLSGLRLVHQWMPNQGTDDERYSKCRRQEPKSNWWKLLPKRQVLSVIHVEGGEQQDVGRPHADDVKPRPIAPPVSSDTPAQIGRSERQRSKK